MCPVYRFDIMAYNTLHPTNIGRSTVEVEVERNVNSPVFNGSYSWNVTESVGLGTRIGQVSATDLDQVSIA